MPSQAFEHVCQTRVRAIQVCEFLAQLCFHVLQLQIDFLPETCGFLMVARVHCYPKRLKSVFELKCYGHQ